METLFFRVFKNKVLFKHIFNSVREIHSLLRLEDASIQRPFKYSEIYNVDWMLKNGYVELFVEKFKKSKRENDKFQLNYNKQSIRLICLMIRDFDLFVEIYQFLGEWMFMELMSFCMACEAGNIDIIRFLIDKIKLKFGDSDKPFEYAVRSGKREVIEFIITKYPCKLINWSHSLIRLLTAGFEDIVNKYCKEFYIEKLYYLCSIGRTEIVQHDLKIQPHCKKDLENMCVKTFTSASLTLQEKKDALEMLYNFSQRYLRFKWRDVINESINYGDLEIFKQLLEYLDVKELNQLGYGFIQQMATVEPSFGSRIAFVEYLLEKSDFLMSGDSLSKVVIVPIPAWSYEILKYLCWYYIDGKRAEVRFTANFHGDFLKDLKKIKLLEKYNMPLLKDTTEKYTVENLNIAKYLDKILPKEIPIKVYLEAYSSTITDIDFLFENSRNPRFQYDLVMLTRNIVNNGRLDLIEYIWDEKPGYLAHVYNQLDFKQLLSISIDSNRFEVFQFIWNYCQRESKPVKLRKSHLHLALDVGNLETCKFIHSYLELNGIAHIINSFIPTGNLPLIQFIHYYHSEDFDRGYFKSCLNSNQLSIYQYLFEFRDDGDVESVSFEKSPQIYEYLLTHDPEERSLKNTYRILNSDRS
ncbi:hypothetical protein DLAC_10957 [Tieghemostelium lacteum]|uniref:Ankyrin repeat-containing protein n=1 Tax=Tieghemostelium lacteum TaxID=361077 RepID=A0A151Z2T0_TIELA|nr:hypothetical protein DLAC_10957 [Tieghemostelium lacteum]|eukprot:KYQ88265.1 hypothetical protein DLAC_10957 [Tieghemostelium lacteum]